ncbi:MAG: dihydroneopterin aldolase [Pseudomonadota bacterium]
MDFIYLNEVKVETIIGVWNWERQRPRRLVLDLELGCDLKPAGDTDELNATIDYKAVTDTVSAFAAEHQYQLLESFAEQLAALLLSKFSLKRVRIKVNKQGVLRNVRDVGVVIERQA